MGIRQLDTMKGMFLIPFALVAIIPAFEASVSSLDKDSCRSMMPGTKFFSVAIKKHVLYNKDNCIRCVCNKAKLSGECHGCPSMMYAMPPCAHLKLAKENCYIVPPYTIKTTQATCCSAQKVCKDKGKFTKFFSVKDLAKAMADAKKGCRLGKDKS